MIIIGLTGGIGMGKSTLARQCARFGAKICNADDIVHRLLGKGGAAVDAVSALFPTARHADAIDRKILGSIVFNDKAALQQLEQLLHPLVIEAEDRFMHSEQRKGIKVVILDIPLLFETGSDRRCDMTILASAPFFIQRHRVMQRPGMTQEKFMRIVRAQMPDHEKRALADVVVETGLGKAFSFRKIQQVMEDIHAA
jgi:dephospho-CoA kinase